MWVSRLFRPIYLLFNTPGLQLMRVAIACLVIAGILCPDRLIAESFLEEHPDKWSSVLSHEHALTSPFYSETGDNPHYYSIHRGNDAKGRVITAVVSGPNDEFGVDVISTESLVRTHMHNHGQDFDRHTEVIKASLLFERLINAAKIARRDSAPSYRALEMRLPRKTYVFDENASEHIVFDGVFDLTLDGNHSKLVFNNPQRNAITIENSKRIHLKNFTLDLNHLAAVRARVVASSSGNAVRFLDNQPDTPNGIDDFDSLYTFNLTEKRWHTGGLISRRALVRDVPDGMPLWRSIGNGLFQSNDADFNAALEAIEPGRDAIVLRARKGMAGMLKIEGPKARDITIDSLTFNNTAQMFMYIHGARGVKISNCKIFPLQERLVAGRADAIHIAGSRGDIVIENNLIRGNGDDGINVRALDYTISEVFRDSNNQPSLRIQNEGRNNRYSYLINLLKGDKLAFFDEQRTPLGFARIAHVEEVSRTERILTLAEGPYTPLDSLFDSLEVGHHFFNINLAAHRFIIRNNSISNNPARGMVIQGANGVVAQNSIHAVGSAGILLSSFNGHFFEGPGATNVNVFMNTLSFSNKFLPTNALTGGAISAFVEQSVTTVSSMSAFPVIQDVKIGRNSIENAGGPGLQISHTRGVQAACNEFFQINRNRNLSLADSQTVSRRYSYFEGFEFEHAINVRMSSEARIVNNFLRGDETAITGIDAFSESRIENQIQTAVESEACSF